ncbi:hypothetical protein CPB86DRAFT_686302, partial [Serendipita vermifera]
GGPVLSPLQIIDSLEQTIEKAKATGDLKMYESQVSTAEERGVQYEIRLCPALQQKEEARVPKSNIAPDPSHVSKVVETIFHKDPFLPPFNSLLIGEMNDDLEEGGVGYYTLLNKYAVVPGHFLLVTRVYESQSQPLTPSQLVHTYLLLLAAKARNKQYFAFFNCGVLSGASQPHKHIQIIPGEPPIERLARSAKVENEARAFVIPQLPFAANIKRLRRSSIDASSPIAVRSPVPSSDAEKEILESLSEELSMSFMAVLDEMYNIIRVKAEHDRERGITSTTSSTTSSGPSYNVVMTLEHIYLFPRTAEKFIMGQPPSEQAAKETTETTTEDSSTYLSLPINSLGFAGALLVKSEEELRRVKEVGVGKMLLAVGMEPLKDEDNKGCDDVFADLA